MYIYIYILFFFVAGFTQKSNMQTSAGDLFFSCAVPKHPLSTFLFFPCVGGWVRKKGKKGFCDFSVRGDLGVLAGF